MAKYNCPKQYQAIVIGVSVGGLNALSNILPALLADFPVPVIIVQHISQDKSDNFLTTILNERCGLRVKEADEKEKIAKGNVYLAPRGYHLLVEKDKTFSLSIDEVVNYSRPSIDVLFESAAEAYSSGLIGIVLTGASSDGANGLKKIKESGGIAIVQDPDTAEGTAMPLSAIQACKVDHKLPLDEIGEFLANFITQ